MQPFGGLNQVTPEQVPTMYRKEERDKVKSEVRKVHLGRASKLPPPARLVVGRLEEFALHGPVGHTCRSV